METNKCTCTGDPKRLSDLCIHCRDEYNHIREEIEALECEREFEMDCELVEFTGRKRKAA